MYIDLIIFVLLIIAVIAFFKDFQSVIYLIVAVDILYRLLHFIANNVNVEELTVLIYKYIPSSVPNMIGNYVGLSNTFYTIITWVMFLIYAIFLGFTIRAIVKRKI